MMFGHVIQIDEYIIQIDHDTNIQKVRENVIHKSLKGHRSIDKTKRHYRPLSGMVHTRVEVHRMDMEMSKLVKRPWLQLICCAICLLHSHNFR